MADVPLRPPLSGAPMPALPPHGATATTAEIVATVGAFGWCAIPGFLDDGEVAGLRHEAEGLHRRGSFRQAGVGRGPDLRPRPEIRGDFVNWLDPVDATPAQARYLERMETLRVAVNEELLLGLFDFEAHLAVYPAGSFYRTHLDRFASAPHRTLTAILYLNEAWSDTDSGLLRLYLQEPDRPPWLDVAPRGGTLVLFLAGDFHHEVLPARRERWSLVGWFGTRR